MTEKTAYYRNLMTRYLSGDCSPQELDEVMDFLAGDASNRILLEALRQEFGPAGSPQSNISESQSSGISQSQSSGISQSQSSISAAQSQRIREALLKKIHSSNDGDSRSRRWYFAAAASLLLVVVTGIFFTWLSSSRSGRQLPVATAPERYHNDVQPGGDKAVLTLANGSKIILDDAKDGELADQGNTRLVKRNGGVTYQAGHTGAEQVGAEHHGAEHCGADPLLYNTITTPRGGQYRVLLPDGSQVWLNAASSLTIPTSFSGPARKVTITGEAYFEVAQNAFKPFVASVNGAEIRVLGTHFNVMAYADEGAIRTTLLQGSVRVINGRDSGLLKPGQQSRLEPGGALHVINNVDVDEVMAWKNGLIHFQDADLKTVMRQLSRWYDVDVEYRNGSFNHRFVGELPRTLSLSNVLKALEVTGKLKFSVDGRKIIVLPDNN